MVAAAKARWAAAASGLASKGKLIEDPFAAYDRDSTLEVPFNSSRKMMATVHSLKDVGKFDRVTLTQDNPGASEYPFTHVAVLKGAPDRVSAVIGVCREKRRCVFGDTNPRIYFWIDATCRNKHQVIDNVKRLLHETKNGAAIDWSSKITEEECLAIHEDNHSLSEVCRLQNIKHGLSTIG